MAQSFAKLQQTMQAVGGDVIRLDQCRPTQPKYEVMLPEHKQVGGAHSLIAGTTIKDLAEDVSNALKYMETCPDDCECRD